jgi:hypothetical protein
MNARKADVHTSHCKRPPSNSESLSENWSASAWATDSLFKNYRMASLWPTVSSRTQIEQMRQKAEVFLNRICSAGISKNVQQAVKKCDDQRRNQSSAHPASRHRFPLSQLRNADGHSKDKMYGWYATIAFQKPSFAIGSGSLKKW